jgi:hypothetical protein
LDFTIKTFQHLLEIFHKQDFSFQSLTEFIENPNKKVILLRHDVDRLPRNSLIFAKIENDFGLYGTYYFRAVPDSWDESIIQQIATLGHEVGYHYEDVSFVVASQKIKFKRQKSQKSDLEEELANLAIKSFKKNLEELRKISPVKTICMHGNPMNRWDNRLMWQYYDYRDFDIIGEPYFDINFKEVLYLTDTGRRWDGSNYNIRDKEFYHKFYKENTHNIKDTGSPSPPLPLPPSFHSTFDIIKAAEEGLLPDKIMMTFHPQRWTNRPLPWIKELVWQNTKNIAKYFLAKFRNS